MVVAAKSQKDANVLRQNKYIDRCWRCIVKIEGNSPDLAPKMEPVCNYYSLRAL